MTLRRTGVLALVLVAVLAIAGPVSAANPFANSTTTANGYHTWDSDQINIEGLSQTGKGVYVAVIDTGLAVNWTDYFPQARVRTDLGTGFYQSVNWKSKPGDPCALDPEYGPLQETSWQSARSSTHGTHVASTIIGYNYYSNTDAAQGFALPPIQVRGIAPNATIIPVKVLDDYQVPALPNCPEGASGATLENFGTDEMVAAGIDHVTDLANSGIRPMVINMSLGGSVLEPVEKAALDRAIAAGVIVVASAGNEGTDGMGYPGAYAPVISVGASGWTGEWLDDGASGNEPANGFRYRMWWLKDKANGDLTPPLFEGSGDVTDATSASHVYVTDFSSRQLSGQQLDVLAPGSWVRGPLEESQGHAQLPWHSKGIADLVGTPLNNFLYVGGTSMASPHVAALAAMMLEKNPSLTQAQVESTLKSTALRIGAGSRQVWDPFAVDANGNSDPRFVTVKWGKDAAGSGLVQANLALAATR